MKVKYLTSSLKYHLKSVASPRIWEAGSKLIQSKRELAFSEKAVRNGSAKIDSEVYVIRRRPPGGGLFSNVNHVMQGVEYATRHNLIPIADMKNYWTTYSQGRSFHDSYNAWEYFFEPISGVKLENLRDFASVRYSAGDRINAESILADRSLSFVLDHNSVDTYGSMYQQYVRMNWQTLKLIDEVKELIKWSPDTIGVSYRGTDYLELMARGHARQPEIAELRSNLLKKLQEDPSAKILISTDDGKARESLASSVKNKAYLNFRDENILRKFVSNKDAPSPQVMNALGYLIEVILLSEGKTIVCSIANGSAAAILLNQNRYIDPCIINKGTY